MLPHHAEARRQVEVLGQRGCRPPAGRVKRAATHEHAVPAQLGGAVGRPAPALAGHVHQLLLVLRRGEPRPVGVRGTTLDLEGRGGTVALPAANRVRQEPGTDARVGVDRHDHVATQIRLGKGKCAALRPRHAIRVAANDAQQVRMLGGQACDARPGAVGRAIVEDEDVELRIPPDP